MICAACNAMTELARCQSCGEKAHLAESYRLEALLASGHAATTYRAIREEDALPVVIKEIVVSRARAEKARELFEREARILAQLDHPQIPVYIDDFSIPRGKTHSLYLVLGFIEGVTLAAELAVHRYSETEVLDICAELSEVLSYLHGLSPPVVHRDLKPSNVMRATDGQLILIDFGAVRDAISDSHIGGSTVAGTFGFMAPEQFRGEATPATDLYGLGALAVALLTRKAPHDMLDPSGRLQWHEHVAVSADCRGRIDALLSPLAEDRPSSALAVMNDMRRRREEVRRDPRLLEEAPSTRFAEADSHPLEYSMPDQPPVLRDAMPIEEPIASASSWITPLTCLSAAMMYTVVTIILAIAWGLLLLPSL